MEERATPQGVSSGRLGQTIGYLVTIQSNMEKDSGETENIWAPCKVKFSDPKLDFTKVTTLKAKLKHLLRLSINQKLLLALSPIADTGHRMGDRNVRCDPASGWEKSY
ncbi:hypothetical protein TNCV_2109891 [Trichonephila clavipes]|nr:hypothetical protein TNCV_2109891 [Trichonephila clavipes]